MKTPMHSCPKFNYCNAPLCPQDPDIELRTFLEGENTCQARKKVRFKLGQGLPYHGLSKREYSMMLRHYGSVDAYKMRLNEKKSEITIGKKTNSVEKGSDTPPSIEKGGF